MADVSMYDLSTISSGVDYLKDGYLEYAKEVITGRALADCYDGLKPVNRRILVTLYNDKVTKAHKKSASVAGNVLALHPHGDVSVYAAMVLMTQRNGTLAFPLVDGSGNFGGVYKEDPPAASRYTEVKLHANTKEYFAQMHGIDEVPNFDSTLKEPVVLPVSFPAVLVNSTSGIAVGFRSNIPSFNFVDVCNLVIEYIDKGQCSTVIEPDFVTGGYYVRNQKELLKLMRAGSAKLKLRAKHTVDGKKIIITEVPFGKTIQKLVKQINALDESSIRNAYDTDDYDHGAGFTVDCSSKNRVDEALWAIIKNTDFQYTYSADVTVVLNGIPRRMGVWEIIEEWVKWRRGVVERELTYQRDAMLESIREARAFMTIVNDYDKRMELVNLIADKGRDAGREYIRKNFTREQVPEDLIDFCATRSLPSYHDGGRMRDAYLNGEAAVNALEKQIADVDTVIRNDMLRLIREYGPSMKRRTEITTQDYNFLETEKSEEKFVDTSYCAYEVKDNFIKRLRYPTGQDAQYVIEGAANDVLIAFDNRGRILRVYGQDLPLSGAADVGTYLPNYLGIKESDDYKVLWIGRMLGQTLMLLYKDGNVGFVDTSEWLGNNRNVKVLNRGISTASAPVLGAVLEDIPEMLYVSDTDGNIAWANVSEIKRKDRTAKTRVFDLHKGKFIDSYLPCDFTVGSVLVNNYGVFANKLKPLADFADFRGDPDEFVDMM